MISKIAIVDDHQFIIDGIKKMLSREKEVEVVMEFINPEVAASKICQADELQLLISDLSMPQMSGLELINKVKVTRSDLKVLVLTMHDDAQHIQEIANSGAEGYLLKSADKEEFLEAVNRILDGGTYYTQAALAQLMTKIKLAETESVVVNLSEREKEVLLLILEEKTSKEIADQLFISKRTVDTHRKNIMEKTESKTLVGLMKYGLSAGVIKLE